MMMNTAAFRYPYVLMKQTFDLNRLELTDEPSVLVDRLLFQCRVALGVTETAFWFTEPAPVRSPAEVESSDCV